jgi:hypothetical protein
VRRATGALLVAMLAACGEPDIMDGATLMLASHGAGNPTAAVHGDVAYFAWIETRDSVSDVYLRRVDGDGVSTPIRVNDIAGDAAPHEQAPPQVKVSAGGAVYVVWQNNRHIAGRRFPASNLRFARSLDGGRTFEPAIFVNDDAAGPPSSHTFQDLAVGGDGTIYISWIDGRERTRAESAPDAGAAGEHAHHAGGMPGSQVRVARSTDGGGTFGSGVVVHENVCPCCRTSLAVHGTRVAVSFRSSEGNLRDIVVAQSTDGGMTFGAPVRVHADSWQVESCPHAGASLAFDGDGRLHVVWYTGAEERQGLWYARTAGDASGFETPVPINTGGWIPVSQAKLAVDAAGDAWIAWDDRREKEPVVRLSRARGGRLQTMSGTFHGQSPALAAGAAVIIAWQRGDSAAARVLRTGG